MKTVSDLLHRTPWWALVGAGLLSLVALGLFATPFRLLRLEHSGATAAQNLAIKHEIDTTLSESAIDVARRVLREMRRHARDPARRDELDHALAEVEQARRSLRLAGAETRRSRDEAAQTVARAVKDAQRAIAGARKEAGAALEDPGVAAQVGKSLDESLAAARRAQDEALRGAEAAEPAATSSQAAAAALAPELRAQIRSKVTGDLYRLGIGAGLILVFIPLLVLAIISKVFIDRSRAAQGMAEMKRKEAEYHRMSRQVTEAKLSALQAQVEPHFLYNTLASVQALTEVDPGRAHAMTGHLIQYLRNALPKMRESVSTLGQEIDLVRAYLNILQMRMGERLAFEIAVPDELRDAPFPPLMLPSLVENAVKHGLEPQREGGSVAIAASKVDGHLRVTVADTGRGFPEVPGHGVGLANIRERLAALYGDGAKLTLEANAPHGVRATIEVPPERVRAATAAPPPAPARPEQPQGAAARTLAAMGSAERAWRKGLSFAFVVLVAVAAVAAGLGIVAVASGAFPVHVGEEELGGAMGALLGTAGIAAAFAVVVLALALVLAIVYGLGFLIAGIALFLALVILVSLFPVLAPLILLGLLAWWLVRRSRRNERAPPEPGRP